MSESYWWCPICKQEVAGNHATYCENHDECGGRLETITEPELLTLLEQQKHIAELEAELKSYKDYVGFEMYRSDFQTAAQMREALRQARKELAKYKADGTGFALENRIMELEGQLARYNKSPKPCIKCGHPDINTHYHATKYDCSYGCLAKVDTEHLHYYCRNCSYDWAGPIPRPEEQI
jgi:hypothetical protein